MIPVSGGFPLLDVNKKKLKKKHITEELSLAHNSWHGSGPVVTSPGSVDEIVIGIDSDIVFNIIINPLTVSVIAIVVKTAITAKQLFTVINIGNQMVCIHSNKYAGLWFLWSWHLDLR